METVQWILIGGLILAYVIAWHSKVGWDGHTSLENKFKDEIFKLKYPEGSIHLLSDIPYDPDVQMVLSKYERGPDENSITVTWVEHRRGPNASVTKVFCKKDHWKVLHNGNLFGLTFKEDRWVLRNG